MPILAVDEARGTFDHACPNARCQAVRRGLKLDPTAGDLLPNTFWDEVSGGPITGTITIRICPLCRTEESLNARIHGYEALEDDATPHPDARVGETFENTGGRKGVVTEHHIGHYPHPWRVAQARLIRQMQRHPRLAPHAPVREAPQTQGVSPGHLPPHVTWHVNPFDPRMLKATTSAASTSTPTPPPDTTTRP